MFINEFGGIDMNEYLAQAISEVNNLNEGEEFLVRDLFKGYAWNRMTMGTKLSLNTLFLNEANTNKSLNISVLGKNSSHQSVFKKI